MKTWIAVGAGLALLAGGVAVAQTAGGPPPAGEAAPFPGGPPDHGPMGGPDGMRHGPRGYMDRMMRMRPPPSKAAHFLFRKEGATVAIKCADDEPTKACVDAASALLDKLAPPAK